MKYDYLIVGSGLFGATFAYRAMFIVKKWKVSMFTSMVLISSILQTKKFGISLILLWNLIAIPIAL